MSLGSVVWFDYESSSVPGLPACTYLVNSLISQLQQEVDSEQ